MQRISLAWFGSLGQALAPLSNSQSVDKISLLHLYQARQYIAPLAEQQRYPLDIRASIPVIRDLLTKINHVLDGDENNVQPRLDNGRWDIWITASKLETLLFGELAVQPVYHVLQKRAYNIETLVATGENLFSDSVKAEFTDDERYNIREAGKCLAFEIPTAAAFHLFRCAESVLRRYYEVVVGTLPKTKMRNWGTYIKNLRTCGADDKVVATLEQIKDMHRNPVIHPDSKIDVDEAFSLIGIVG